ncbi:hypothetical protein RND71_002073 [Anisodus tanguticus]|uniref:Uncharacterized protein n=1 Tax=Anisodus tanguticus TaxID=243964 RepID=A0AAE1T3E9_9SOLA|nr:hypothetical protein RND71_002073 [Anisodus tanguticus]
MQQQKKAEKAQIKTILTSAPRPYDRTLRRWLWFQGGAAAPWWSAATLIRRFKNMNSLDNKRRDSMVERRGANANFQKPKGYCLSGAAVLIYSAAAPPLDEHQIEDGIACKGWFLAKVIPIFSSVSKSFGLIPASSFQLKQFKSEPNITGTILNTSGKASEIIVIEVVFSRPSIEKID